MNNDVLSTIFNCLFIPETEQLLNCIQEIACKDEHASNNSEITKFSPKDIFNLDSFDNNFSSCSADFDSFELLIKHEIDNDFSSLPVISCVYGNYEGDQMFDKSSSDVSSIETKESSISESLNTSEEENINIDLYKKLELYLVTWKKIFVWMTFETNNFAFCCKICITENNKYTDVFTLNTEDELLEVAKMLRFHECSKQHKVNCIKQPGLISTLFFLLKNLINNFRSIEDITHEMKRLLPNNIIYDSILVCAIQTIGHWLQSKLINTLVVNANDIYSVILHYCKGYMIVRYVDQNLKAHEVTLFLFIKTSGFKGFSLELILNRIGLLPKNCVSCTVKTCGRCDCVSVLKTIEDFNASQIYPPSVFELYLVLHQFTFFAHYFSISRSLNRLYDIATHKFSSIDNHHFLSKDYFFSIYRVFLIEKEQKKIREICHDIFLSNGSMEALGMSKVNINFDKNFKNILLNFLSFFSLPIFFNDINFEVKFTNIVKNFHESYHKISQIIQNDSDDKYLKELHSILGIILAFCEHFVDFKEFQTLLIEMKNLTNYSYLNDCLQSNLIQIKQSTFFGYFLHSFIDDKQSFIINFIHNLGKLQYYDEDFKNHGNIIRTFQVNVNMRYIFSEIVKFYKLMLVFPTTHPSSKGFSFFYLDYLFTRYSTCNNDSILWCLFCVHLCQSFSVNEFLSDFESYID